MALVLLNPHAQGGRAKRFVPRIAAWLEQHAPTATWAAPDSLADALEVLQQQPAGTRVVAVGGDGTVNRWLPTLMTQQLELGLVPMGSGNDLARAIGVHGGPWQTALQHALAGPCHRIDVGLALFDGQRVPFLSSLTAGFDSAVGKRALEGPTWLRGLPRYVWATLQELAHIQAWHLRISAQGQCWFDGPSLFASSLNTPTFGSGMPAAPHADIADGQLAVLHAAKMYTPEALVLLPKLLTGRHLGHSKVHLWSAAELLIESTSDLPLASDGEYLGVTRRLQLQVLPLALPIVMRTS